MKSEPLRWCCWPCWEVRGWGTQPHSQATQPLIPTTLPMVGAYPLLSPRGVSAQELQLFQSVVMTGLVGSDQVSFVLSCSLPWWYLGEALGKVTWAHRVISIQEHLWGQVSLLRVCEYCLWHGISLRSWWKASKSQILFLHLDKGSWLTDMQSNAI